MATIKQERAIQNLVETRGNVSKAMVLAGYSPISAKNPSNLTKSVAFSDLLERYLPEKRLLTKHREFLEAKRITRTYQRGDLKEITEETDPNAVRALDMAYKLKGKYKTEGGNSVLIINVSNQSSERYKARTVEPDGTDDHPKNS